MWFIRRPKHFLVCKDCSYLLTEHVFLVIHIMSQVSNIYIFFCEILNKKCTFFLVTRELLIRVIFIGKNVAIAFVA
jgi:hypothetical protein